MTGRHLLTLVLAHSLPLAAQAPAHVQWTASARPEARPGDLIVTVQAAIERGWHVYAQSQPPGGPLPLLIQVDDGASYRLRGAIASSTPTRHHDVSLNLDTEFYTDGLSLRVPVRSAAQGAAQQNTGVPLMIRFQACSETTCMPPKTVHLTANASGA